MILIASIHARANYFYILNSNSFQLHRLLICLLLDNCVVAFLVDEGILGNNAAACRPDYSTVIKVKTIHISSPILAAKSPFFYKVRSCQSGACLLNLKLFIIFVFNYCHLVIRKWDERVGAASGDCTGPCFW